MATWILTGSLENFRISAARGFDVVGFKERWRNQALEFAPGDEIVFYVTGAQAFGGLVRVCSEVFEDRTPIWPRGSKPRPEEYPWRVATEPVAILDESDFVQAQPLAPELEHVRKWPLDHWQLAFQGQLRAIPEADAELLSERIGAAARAGSAASA
jgi:predicted RNA-binding protein